MSSVENGEIPKDVQAVIILVGTNNIDRDGPSDIAHGIATIGMLFQAAKPHVKVMLVGLLPRGLGAEDPQRTACSQVNRYLQGFCEEGSVQNMYYLPPDKDWIQENGLLNMSLYYTDYLHLEERGNEKLAIAIASKLSEMI